MAEKRFISEYKGFELWDCPMPEGWRVHPYPVQVTCNGEHVNNFADTDDAMKTIDGMDAYTVAYHKRQAPAPAVASAAADDDEAELFELGIHRMIAGLWRVSHKDGVASMELVAEDDIDPKDTLANIHYKRIKQLEEQRDNNAETAMSLAKHVGALEAELDSVKAALKPFAAQWAEWLAYVGMNGEMSLVDFFTDYLEDSVLETHLKDAAQALQASAPPADGEAWDDEHGGDYDDGAGGG